MSGYCSTCGETGCCEECPSRRAESVELNRLRASAASADRHEGISLAGLSKEERKRLLASGTEAGTGETEGLDPKGDGPVGAAETPTLSPIAPVQDDDAECAHKETKLIDYDPAFHDGEVVCADCGAHVRWWDAG